MKKFIWLFDDASPRRGPTLKKNETYEVSIFGDEIVAEWVKSGAAAYEEESPRIRKSKLTKEVNNATNNT